MKRKRDSSPDMARMSACADDGDSSSGANRISLSGAEYEVFLSFRGTDTRLNFTDSLYHFLVGAGIGVFKDNEEIREGEKIGGELLAAIESSKIYMPIFSENYASSAWCLRELAHMVKCAREATDKVILPIFCGAKPDDLKLKDKSLYLDHMEKHEKKFSHDDVQQWKEALKEVASIKGWDLEGKGQGEIITTIVSRVLAELMKRIILPDQIVGIHGHVKAFMRLSPEDSPDVHYPVIHGMGGIENRSRLWEPKIAFNVVRSRQGTDKVIAFRVTGFFIEYDFTNEEFPKMPNLRFLELEGGNLVGDFKNLLSKLTWLSWSNCPSELHATNLCLEKLVVLKLSGSNITEDWAGWKYLVNKDLKVIQITECPNLRRTPDVLKCSKLKRLVLQGGKTSLVANGSLSKLVVSGFCQD